MVHLKLDEQIPLAVARLLRTEYATSTVHSQHLDGISDPALARHCAQHDYVLITADKDFLQVAAFPPARYAGILVLRPTTLAWHTVLDLLEHALHHLDMTTVRGHTIEMYLMSVVIWELTLHNTLTDTRQRALEKRYEE